MTFAASERIGISRQRGFWLRCFLGISFLCVMARGVVCAQVELDKAVHLGKAEGVVVNTLGKPVAHAEVVLAQDGKAVFTTRTDDRGGFRFDHASGRYTFRVEAHGVCAGGAGSDCRLSDCNARWSARSCT